MKLILMTFILLTASIGFSNESINDSALLNSCISGPNQVALSFCMSMTSDGDFNIKAHSMCRALGESNVMEMITCLNAIRNKSYSEAEITDCSGARNGDLQVDCFDKNGSTINDDQSISGEDQPETYDEYERGSHHYGEEVDN